MTAPPSFPPPAIPLRSYLTLQVNNDASTAIGVTSAYHLAMADDRLMQARKRRPATLQELGGAEVTQFKAMPAAFLNAGARGFDHPTSPPAPDRFLKKQQGLGGRGIQKHKLALAGLHNNPTPTPTPDTQIGRGEEVAAERLERGIAPSKHTLWRRMYERRDFPLRMRSWMT